MRRILVENRQRRWQIHVRRELARWLRVPFVELDALHRGPNWHSASAAELQ